MQAFENEGAVLVDLHLDPDLLDRAEDAWDRFDKAEDAMPQSIFEWSVARHWFKGSDIQKIPYGVPAKAGIHPVDKTSEKK